MLDCVIVGAGLAGLAAAAELQRRGKTVQVLEARDRVGGRVENATLSDGQVIELGGQWISPSNDRALDLVARFGGTLLAPGDGKFLMRMQGHVTEVDSGDNRVAQRTPFEVADLGQGLLRFQRLAARMANDPMWAQANAAWLNQDLDRWLTSNLRTPGGAADFREVLWAVFTEGHATLCEGLVRANEGLDLETLIAVKGGLKQKRVQGGLWSIIQRLADAVGVVRLGVEVVAVQQDAESATVTLNGGEQIKAHHVLLAIPPWLAQSLEFSPALPAWRNDVVHKSTPGNVIKAHVVYERPWWRDHGWSGQMSADAGSVRVCFDTTDPGATRGVLMSFFEGAEAATVSGYSRTLRQRSLVDSLVKVFGREAESPVDYIDRDWGAEPYSLGCHGAHFAPGVWSVNGQLLAEAYGRVHFAGAEYAAKFNGYLEGAIRSGEDAAVAITKVNSAFA